MRYNKLLSIMAVMLIIGIFMIVFGEMMGGNKKKNPELTPEMTGELTEEISTTEHRAQKDEGAYSYSDVQIYVGYLADSEDTQTELNRLVDPLTASDSITVAYIKKVVDVLGVDSNVYTGVLKGKADSDTVKIEEFEKIYRYIVDSDVITGIEHNDIYVFGRNVSEESDDGTADRIFDGENQYSFDVEISEEYNNKIIDVYTKNGVIFKLNGYSQESITLPDVWLIEIKDGKGSFLYKDVKKEYPAISTLKETDIEELKGGFVADVTIDNVGIKAYSPKTEVKEISVSEIGDNRLISDTQEEYKLADNYMIYNAGNEPYCENSLGILKGYDSVELIMDDDEVDTIIIRKALNSDNIRVLLSNSDYSSYDMDTITISCDTAYSIQYPNGDISEKEPGTTVTIDHKAYEEGDKIRFTPVSNEGRLQVLNINRDYGNPSYRGSLEIDVTDESLRLINELLLEEYLYSVVASEMNSNSPPEALKAMAICARGYAYSRIQDESFSAYDAHIDDSNLCQMYNSVEETESTRYAVKETYGIVPTHNGKIITPLYFSTSAGVTCTNSDIWGGNNYEYLEANVEDLEKSAVDLSDENKFIEFMNNSLSFNTIEKDMPYYRWNVEFTSDEISKAINSTLRERFRMSSENISVLRNTEDGDVFVNEKITDIGKVISVSITERSKSGVVLTMEIRGTKAVISVTGQTNIRNLITPVDAQINKQDGTSVTGWTSLPSPFYYIEKSGDSFKIVGGGFGHGAGMSQNGARKLAEDGYDCQYILKHYYSDIEISSVDDVK